MACYVASPKPILSLFGNPKFLFLVVPCAFVAVLWAFSDGVPYFRDNNETFLSYIQGWALYHSNPLSFSFLTAQDLSPVTRIPGYIYTHNPNFPRYVHFVLFSLGMHSFKAQVLVITLTASSAAFWFLYRFVGFPLSILVALPLLLDFVGSQYLTNTYRVFAFALFFGCLLAMKTGRLIPLAFFALWQFEYCFALFVSVVCAVMFYEHPRRWLLAAAGLVASIVIFVIQVYSHVGSAGLISAAYEAATKRAVNPMEAVIELIRMFKYAYNPLILLCLVFAVGSAIHAVLRHRGDSQEVLSRLYLSMGCGLAIILAVLPGYTADAYFQHALPFMTFFVAVAFAILSLRLTSLAMFPSVVAVGALSVLLVANSINEYSSHPPLGGGYALAIRQLGLERVALDTTMQGAAFGPAGAWEELVTRDGARGANHYLCLHRPWHGVDCAERRSDFRQIIIEGPNFFIATNR